MTSCNVTYRKYIMPRAKSVWHDYCLKILVKLFFKNRVKNSLFCSRLSARCFLSAATAFTVILFLSSVAYARLSGDASLTYSSYDGRTSGSNRMSSNSLVQNYSLLYSSNGPIYNSRVGRYDVALGYNWTALDTSFRSSTQPNERYNETRGHLLYKGEINLDPKEVPFRLNAYSRDMTSNTIAVASSRNPANFASVFGDRNQAVDINDGMHIESGATLIAGVKNGMTNGYNEILRHFPMILVDYKDTINRDLRSMTPVNDRLSRLAFVSLNKKENWFHYRHTLYEDYLNTNNNYAENEVQLGTVDQYMSRRWIDFTNWLKVSTDLQLSKRKSNYQVNSIEDINLNVFVTAERNFWNARTFTTFNRYKDENNKLSYQSTLPLYASGVVNQNISWNARTSYRNNHDIDAQGISSTFTNMLVGYRVDAFKRSLFTLSQNFDIESSQTNTSDYLTLSGRLETASTPRFSRDVTLGASYNIKNSSTAAAMVSTSDFLEQTIELRGGYAPTNMLRFEVRQNNTFTKGNLSPFSGTTRNSETQLTQYINPRSISASDAGSESYHSLSTLTMSWNPKPRLNAVVTLNEDIYKSAVLGVNTVTEVLSAVSFTNDVWSLNDSFKYTRGNRETMDEEADSVSNSAAVRYIHSRNLDASASASYSTSFLRGDSYSDTAFEQRVNYNYFTKSGIARKLFEVNETLQYSDGTANESRTFNKSLILGLKYYPIRQLTLATGVGYTYSTSISDYTLVWNASAVANFRLLQASVDFVHGIRKSDGASENRFTGNIRKSF